MAKAGVVIARTVLLSGADDIEILRELRRAACIVNKSATRAQAPSGANSGRSASRLRDMDWAFAIIRSALRRSGTADAPARVRLLDIGCAEGSHTEAVAETLKIPADDAHACDVMPQPANPRFQFRLCDRKTELLPYEDAEFNLILMLMSEHHFAKPEVVFEEAARVTAPGGFLIMRDHDAQTAEQCAFFDIVHALYDCVLGDAPVAPERFLADYASGATTFNYRSAMYWVTLAEKYGFKLIGDVRPPAGGPDRFRSFYALFQRRAVTAASAAPSATAK
jgi:SAM-dependent methyltransferase